MFLVYLTIIILGLFLDPIVAHAWGPGTHLDIALTVLQHSFWALPTVRALIETYRDDFIYGAVSPDIIVGKKYAGAIYHCHNWSIGKLILEEAQTDMERAAAWGYLTHLAADTVAHNYFVPFKIIRSFSTRSLSHVYWEMRYDLHIPDHCWKEFKHVIRQDYRPFDHLLERVLKKTIFSFRTNKKIFNSILILQKMKQLRFGLKVYAKASRWELPERDRRHYKELTLETIKDFLRHPQQAKCLKADPAGQRKLLYAAETRKQLKDFTKEKRRNKEITQFLESVKQKLHRGLFDSTVSLPNLYDFANYR
ncbi:MAG: hypothetical protein A2W61_07125 [Deltaproteobacteria bacterium RIFCSPLOWO2_01_44_7]|nr:MAG: hypothetical protein A2712_08180 [Deltaproteobacteria bacterium RIFCSPHIGHO2_01_FULL_43_49]OGQ14685.1 MAG: hypothetical protein A3D22_08820 [Deltaproteobacteria bacterium RIFCSPHIGHO2_02_FULL_44_53]OGQ28071.1 MAG: hypothetical protein A3D98_07530 [Deltaproteobacteria bacterium RIFCSPHIGHO2_12_FULL_44_21]OGQ31283.1 MAG: hypothetical protein A2979_07580 [Deltaproteobacteria bacterium RIFCSPLOWO2_01_FULL_45_74]OGQ41514.1 MAG: hypothetical protein A2W61_07125 [Deltaproteobacteria bacterium 